jgi:dihydrofolate reductase
VGPGPLARLVYSSICSLDLYVNDEQGKFDWAAPDDELHAFVNQSERAAGTYLYGRRMYETMASWETVESDQPVAREFAEIWRAADKVVYSTTLERVSTARTRLEPRFDPDEVRRLKQAAEEDISIGGATLAAEALRAGLIDELHLFLHPVLVGGGTRALPDGAHLKLELLSERRFASGVVHLHYAFRS